MVILKGGLAGLRAWALDASLTVEDLPDETLVVEYESLLTAIDTVETELHRTEKLWAVHVIGPDDIVACVDRAAADALAAGLEPLRQGDPPAWGQVIEWPFSADEHSKALKRAAE